MVFVDTGAWFALHVPRDPNHAAALAWLLDNSEPLVTTDFVVDETLTLLRARHQPDRAIQVGRSLIEHDDAQLHYVTPLEFSQAWILFQQPRANDWSFTDCTSKIVMDSLGIRTAFAFDGHFREFGSIEVVPN